MGKIDTEQEYYNQHTDALASMDIASDMSDHDMLLHHVTQHDHELYMLDCCLSEIMSL